MPGLNNTTSPLHSLQKHVAGQARQLDFCIGGVTSCAVTSCTRQVDALMVGHWSQYCSVYWILAFTHIFKCWSCLRHHESCGTNTPDCCAAAQHHCSNASLWHALGGATSEKCMLSSFTRCTPCLLARNCSFDVEIIATSWFVTMALRKYTPVCQLTYIVIITGTEGIALANEA